MPSRPFGVVLALQLVAAALLIPELCFADDANAGVAPNLTREPGESIKDFAERSGLVSDVIRKYRYYRIVALGLAVLALAAVALSRRPWINGAAAGLLLLVVAQTVIDHYSESRATRYAGQLRAALAGRVEP